MWGLQQKQNARRADKIRLYGHLRRYKKIVKKTYIISSNVYKLSVCLFSEEKNDTLIVITINYCLQAYLMDISCYNNSLLISDIISLLDKIKKIELLLNNF